MFNLKKAQQFMQENAPPKVLIGSLEVLAKNWRQAVMLLWHIFDWKHSGRHRIWRLWRKPTIYVKSRLLWNLRWWSDDRYNQLYVKITTASSISVKITIVDFTAAEFCPVFSNHSIHFKNVVPYRIEG